MTAVLVVAVGLLTAVGIYLLLSRQIFPAILGLSLLAHAANLVVLSTGDSGARAPIVVEGVEPALLADPVPQALVLTAIVISMAVTLYLLALLAASGRRLGETTLTSPPSSDAERDGNTVRKELGGSDGSGA